VKFIDEVTIHLKSGHGGPGAVSFRREAMTPRGGPDGGDGGKGGDVIFEVDRRLGSLLDLKLNRDYFAQNGHPGGASNMFGPSGEDMIIRVPAGTVVKSVETGEVLLDLVEEGRVVFLKGGRGGKGNSFFKTSVNQAPDRAQPGEDSQEAVVRLELKLIADIGIIGFPNAGKSSLIARISAARPKIADYPFTTLVPNLGVVKYDQLRSFVVADIPGLIPGAHQGVGLGTQFLRHIERTRLFVHVVDCSGLNGRDPMDDFNAINEELAAHDRVQAEESGYFAISTRPQIVALNKADIAADMDAVRDMQKQLESRGYTVFVISTATGLGVRELVNKMAERVFTDEQK
jgi:GTP-binding protein